MELKVDSLARRIKMGMLQAGIQNPSILARRMGTSRQTVQSWLSGRSSKLTPDMLYALADALNVNARWLAQGPPHKMTRPAFLGPDEAEIFEVAKALSPEAREQWLSMGRALLKLTQPATTPHSRSSSIDR